MDQGALAAAPSTLRCSEGRSCGAAARDKRTSEVVGGSARSRAGQRTGPHGECCVSRFRECAVYTYRTNVPRQARMRRNVVLAVLWFEERTASEPGRWEGQGSRAYTVILKETVHTGDVREAERDSAS